MANPVSCYQILADIGLRITRTRLQPARDRTNCSRMDLYLSGGPWMVQTQPLTRAFRQSYLLIHREVLFLLRVPARNEQKRSPRLHQVAKTKSMTWSHVFRPISSPRLGEPKSEFLQANARRINLPEMSGHVQDARLEKSRQVTPIPVVLVITKHVSSLILDLVKRA